MIKTSKFIIIYHLEKTYSEKMCDLKSVNNFVELYKYDFVYRLAKRNHLKYNVILEQQTQTTLCR